MNLRQLGYLVAVVDHGSFSRAAAALNLAQPTLSRQIALLEADLGERLLDRTGRGATLTEAGSALVAHARVMLDTAQHARDELRELHASPAGRVIVGLPPRVALGIGAALVQRFRVRFPRAVITLSEGLSLQLHEWLIAGRLDIALLFDPPTSQRLAYQVLTREPLMLVAPAAAQRLPRRVGLSALCDFPMVLPSAPNAIRSVLDAALRPRRLELQVIAEVGAVRTVLALVASGIAYTVLPESATVERRGKARFQRSMIGPPALRNTLVLATPLARPATRLTRETAALLEGLDFRSLGSPP